MFDQIALRQNHKHLNLIKWSIVCYANSVNSGKAGLRGKKKKYSALQVVFVFRFDARIKERWG